MTFHGLCNTKIFLDILDECPVKTWFSSVTPVEVITGLKKRLKYSSHKLAPVECIELNIIIPMLQMRERDNEKLNDRPKYKCV